MDYAERIAAQMNLHRDQVAATIELFDAGNTLPFVARYRKEVTGGLDEEQLRRLHTLLDRLRALEDRRQTILNTIEEQGQLIPELRQQILRADTLTALEDLYRPFRPKRRTRADVARERGLQALADLILDQVRTEQTVEQLAAPFVSDEVPTVEDALTGARDIVAQTVSDHPDVRRVTRERALRWATLHAERKDDAEDPRGTYQLYYSMQAPSIPRATPSQSRCWIERA